jgi:hypothetical protein
MIERAGFKTLDQVKDKFLGKEGTVKRDEYEIELKELLKGINKSNLHEEISTGALKNE